MFCTESKITDILIECLGMDKKDAKNKYECVVELEFLERNVKYARKFAYWQTNVIDDVKFGAYLSICIEIFKYVRNNYSNEYQIADMAKELILRHSLDQAPQYVYIFILKECKDFLQNLVDNEIDQC